MRRTNPLQITSICRRCASLPLRSSVRRTNNTRAVNQSASRLPSQFSALPSTARWNSTENAVPRPIEPEDTSKAPAPAPRETREPAEIVQSAKETRNAFLAVDGIPAHQVTLDALKSIVEAAKSLQPVLKRAEAESKASASKLALLGAERTGTKLPITSKLREAANDISASAYAIISQPNVEITPEVLDHYVAIQALVGRPESLAYVFDLYASKRKPVMKNGVVQYVSQNPNSPRKAIDETDANMALQTAIRAKNLDAALGIIESSFALTAFRRQKMLKHGTTPLLTLMALPFGIFGMATAYAGYLQNTMDVSTATGVAVAGFSGYFFTVGSLGLIAKLSHKDQMKRVTWAPGIPLRERWMREEERAALDRVACAWGFKEAWRHGEETGPEWEGLKEYMGYRGMILDRVEFMQGMN